MLPSRFQLHRFLAAVEQAAPNKVPRAGDKSQTPPGPGARQPSPQDRRSEVTAPHHPEHPSAKRRGTVCTPGPHVHPETTRVEQGGCWGGGYFLQAAASEVDDAFPWRSAQPRAKTGRAARLPLPAATT